ncbi:isoaspartyl peptidase/L-asparaginase [Methylobacterium sp. NEAU 140]|uniref:isoaspartyl peptidase/L-asparaginase family protein n=1 Tax=Methylobacterium sp. NEAU 140 TaxID=3064945 RepID=UPI002735A176|nr:isoaspartyl peptidase/L-asparaginase [Methylobacterium sp. NEAU 140]MDP4022565.1 isoaspartyl peptidase/L-asparaginase [Methylobacterium sp. NEAU 140]
MAAGFVLAVHGGAGTIPREADPARAAGYRAGLERALRAGHAILARGGGARDAVIAAVCILEDDPLFNAGRGSVLTAAGGIEMDAAVMDGRTGEAGAVAGVTGLRNPIVAARAVLEASGHVLMIGPGAEAFARARGVETAGPDYFLTPARRDQLRAAQSAGTTALDHDGAAGTVGTVGAVARDATGALAAATSTGGLTNKRPGRVGDSPLIGAGTYADTSVAVSCTGTGEAFIRAVLAHDIAARLRYAAQSLDAAVAGAIRDGLDARGGRGGVIALDRHGGAALRFNTEGMYRGIIRADGHPETAIHSES